MSKPSEAVELPYVDVLGTGPGDAPGLPIRAVRSDGTLTEQVNALLDSGADVTIFPLDWAARIGVNTTICQRVHRLTAPDAFLPPSGVEIVCQLGRIRLSHALFQPDHIGPILLGRADFFACFEISFDQRGERFWLKPYG